MRASTFLDLGALRAIASRRLVAAAPLPKPRATTAPVTVAEMLGHPFDPADLVRERRERVLERRNRALMDLARDTRDPQAYARGFALIMAGGSPGQPPAPAAPPALSPCAKRVLAQLKREKAGVPFWRAGMEE